MLRNILTSLLLGLALLPSAFPQTKPRPRIGLALEGGAALGIAHVGVLEYFEEHHIPVDYIAGTSMGGLVGGIYASGFTAAELRKILKEADWGQFLSGVTPFTDASYRRKEDRISFPNDIQLNLSRRGVALPEGLNTGFDIGLLLSRLTLAYGDLDSFDQLPTPFRCVAVDLISGKEDVLDKGSLSEAMRATMSIPAVFDPVKRGDKLYVDGGVLHNLPVDVVRRMGADIVIAVHLAKGPATAKELANIGGVIGRTVSVVIAANELRTMEQADVVISVDLSGIESTAYDQSTAIADLGHGAAQKKAKLLDSFALDAPAWDMFEAARQARRLKVPQRVSGVEIRGLNKSETRSLERSLKPFIQGDLDPARFERALSRQVGTGRVSNLRYQISSVKGKPQLVVDADDRPRGVLALRPAIEVDGTDIENFRLSIAARATYIGLGTPRAELRTDLAVGSRYRFATEYWRPFSNDGGWFIAPRAFAANDPFPIYRGGDQIAQYRRRTAGFGFDLGYQFNRFAELRIGESVTWAHVSRKIGVGSFPDFNVRSLYSGASFNYIGTDDSIVPYRGASLTARAGYQFENNSLFDDGPTSEVRSLYFQPVTAHGSLFTGASAGTSFNKRDLGFGSFSFGGPLRLDAYGPNELIGNQYLLGTLGYIHRVSSSFSLLGTDIYGAAWVQAGKMYGDPAYPRVAGSAAGALILRTFFGPITLGGAVGDRGHRRLFFSVGRIF